MCVYSGNGPSELKRSLSSMAAQQYPNIEVNVVFDGPVADELREAVKDVQKNTAVPINTFQLPHNLGLGPALNQAIKMSKGDFFARMDTDDYSKPDRISAQMAYLLSRPETDIVGCCMEEVFENGAHISVTSMPLTHEACVSEFIRRDPIHHPTAVFRRRFFEKAGFYTDEYPLDEDSALWLAGMKSGCIFANIREPKYTMFLTDGFFRRRKSYATISVVFKVRMRIIREMGYGIRGYAWAISRVLVALLPRFALSAAYKIRGRLAELFGWGTANKAAPQEVKVFYRLDPGDSRIFAATQLPDGYKPAVFRFTLWKIFPAGFLASALPPAQVKILCLLWWAKRLFTWGKAPDSKFYLIHEGANLVHYTGVSPRDMRFPFMKEHDLILGPSRTHEEHRRKGLQSHSINEVINSYGNESRIWYVTDEGNIAPRKCVEKIGFPLRGLGVRKRFGPFGILSRYIPQRPLD